MARMDAQPADPAAATPSPAFVPYEGGAPQRDGAVLMVEAYAVAWLVIMGFVLFVHLRQRRLDARISRLEAAMDRVIEERE